MFGLRAPELLIILVLVLVLFGGSRVAGLGSSLGQGIRNFKRGFTGEDSGEPAPGNGTLSSTSNTDTHGAPVTRTPANVNGPKDA